MSGPVSGIQFSGGENLPKKGPAFFVAVDLYGPERHALRQVLSRHQPVQVARLSASEPDPAAHHESDLLLKVAPSANSSEPSNLVRLFQPVLEALAQGKSIAWVGEDYRLPNGTEVDLETVLRLVQPANAPIYPVVVTAEMGSPWKLENGRWVKYRVVGERELLEIDVGSAVPANTSGFKLREELENLSLKQMQNRLKRSIPTHRQFLRVVWRDPNKEFWVDQITGSFTRFRALTASFILARRLKPMLKDQPMVGIWLPTGIGGALANMALTMLGKVTTNLNYTSSQEVAWSCLKQTPVKTVISSRKFTARVPFEAGPGRTMIYLDDILPKVGGLEKAWAGFLVKMVPPWLFERWVMPMAHHKLSDLATIIFSSGSTGDPKGVQLSQENILSNIQALIQFVRINDQDSMLACLPFFHSFGYTVTYCAPQLAGAKVVYHPDPRQAKEIGELARKHKSTVFLSTATFLRFCMKRAQVGDFSTLKLIICGAEKLPVPLAHEFLEKQGVLPLEGYGCTELSPVASTNRPDEVEEGITWIRNRFGTIGSALTGTRMAIVDHQTMEEKAVGEEGMVACRGPNVMVGYLGQPQKTAEVVRNGYYLTGDMGHLGNHRHVTITGRLARFAKIGGEMVPLERLELLLHEAIQCTDRVCAVTCVPDASRGEKVVILYLPQVLETTGVGKSEWLKRLAATGIPALWRPDERDCHPVEEIPSLGSGKLDIRHVKELALKIAGGCK